ncbi:cell wall-binding repeat-containing protein [Herbiconiux sp. VKM Ac-2851]|uniref:cell wall-binding repeat-containing protein n=1 Tax=Herbiconiux sp. VKM Ac-2851 TaxID=2739025 RepID=UPI001563C799|nr:cell wall-binding repeat-containing protein [Herbiconiux sp. VKM Ac-2851]NQX35429.1 cell wall-binding repeat-containing protein [Herbiconiux sp. VKM Ac-2851]
MRAHPGIHRSRRPGAGAARAACRAGLGLTGAALLTVTAFAVPVSAAPLAPAAAPVDSLVAHYDFDGDVLSDGTVTDSSGNGNDATLVNSATATVEAGAADGSSAIVLPGGAVDADGAFVELPTALIGDGTDLTVSARVKVESIDQPWQWLFGIGNDTSRYLFSTPRSGDGELRSAVTVNGGGSAESIVRGSAALPGNSWKTVTVVLDGGSDRLTTYLDGAAIGSTSTTVDASQLLTATSERGGYIGRSLYPDPLFAGAVDDFAVYSSALTADEVGRISGGTVPTLTAIPRTAFEVQTTTGDAPALPPSAAGSFSDGYDRAVPIDWNAVDPADYAAVGTFTVDGTAAGRAVTARVTVRDGGSLSIDLGSDTGAFHGGASGTLYGLYGEGVPSDNLIEGMNLRTVSTKAQDGPQHPGADALEVVKPLADATDGDVYIYMTDIYRGFPYEWPGDTPEAKLADFQAKQAAQVAQVKQLPAEYQDNIVFVPFNEPEGNMFGTGEWSYDGTSWLDDPTDYFAAWDSTYRLIKAELPEARIAGPNTSVLFDQVEGFLAHTVAAGTVPQVMTWHELSDPANIRANVPRYRAMEQRAFDGSPFAGTELPININEYAFNYHTSVPGQMIQWVSAIEDSKVDADIAYWNIDGNLSDSAVQSNRGNGQWWLLNAYSQMSGHTVSVTPPFPGQSYTLQGLATLDENKAQARAILGGKSGGATVSFTDVDTELFGETVHAAVDRIDWTGQIGDSSGPAVVAELDLPVVNGAVTLDFGGSLPALDESSAYEIVLTPGVGTSSPAVPPSLWGAGYEAEAAAHSGTGYSVNGPEGSPTRQGEFYTSGGYDVGGLRTGSDVSLDFSVDVPSDGRYDLSVFANSLNTYDLVQEQGPTNVFVTVDGGAEQEIFLPLGYKWVVWDHADTRVELTAGTHTIRLSATSRDGTRGTKGDAIVDRIDLSLPNPAAADRLYEAEYASLDGGTLDYTQTGVSASGVARLAEGQSATFWVYSAADALSTVDVETLGGGTASLSVNGEDVGTLGDSVSRDLFLVGGVNKLTVTGTGGTLLLDRLAITPVDAPRPTEYQAEDATLAGTAVATPLSRAQGGAAVTGVGGLPGNDSALTFDAVAVPEAGRYALTVRFSNEEQSPATHYNPDPLARPADISVNGAPAFRVLFPHSFHENEFWEQTIMVDLEAGANSIRFTSQEAPSFDGTSYISDTFPGVLLRSRYAPNIDAIRVSPLVGQPLVAPTVDRIAGADRYAVSAATSAAGFPSGSDTVYIASGQAFPDALSAAPAATIAGAPVLLTLGDRIPAPVLAELKRLDPSKIVIVGGTDAVGKKVETELGTIGDVTRIGGADRFAASRSVAAAAFPDGAEVAVLATGRTFPDALSAGAAVKGTGPVVLIDGTASSLDSATTALLTELGVKTIVIAGGTDAVSAGVETAAAKLADVTRLGGEDRYGSSRAINAFFVEKADRVVLATGANFPDALSGSAFAPAVDAPLFTVQTDCIPAETLTQITALGATQVTLLGGTTVLTKAVESLAACPVSR